MCLGALHTDLQDWDMAIGHHQPAGTGHVEQRVPRRQPRRRKSRYVHAGVLLLWAKCGGWIFKIDRSHLL